MGSPLAIDTTLNSKWTQTAVTKRMTEGTTRWNLTKSRADKRYRNSPTLSSAESAYIRLSWQNVFYSNSERDECRTEELHCIHSATPHPTPDACGEIVDSLENWQLNRPKALPESLNERDRFLPVNVVAFHLKLEGATLCENPVRAPCLQLRRQCERCGRLNIWGNMY